MQVTRTNPGQFGHGREFVGSPTTEEPRGSGEEGRDECSLQSVPCRGGGGGASWRQAPGCPPHPATLRERMPCANSARECGHRLSWRPVLFLQQSPRSARRGRDSLLHPRSWPARQTTETEGQAPKESWQAHLKQDRGGRGPPTGSTRAARPGARDPVGSFLSSRRGAGTRRRRGHSVLRLRAASSERTSAFPRGSPGWNGRVGRGSSEEGRLLTWDH